MADFGKQLADLIPGQTPDEKPSPSALPSSVPITGEIKPYDPTFRESAASKIQRGLESMGVNRYKARQLSQTLMGGQSSNLPLGLGFADVIPFVGTGMQTQEAVRGLEAAGQAAKQGDIIGAGVEGVFGAASLIPGAAGTMKAVRAVKPKAPPVQGKIEDRTIPAPFRAQESPAPVKPQGVSYETAQEGPFYRVRPNLPEATGRQNRGTKEGVGRPPGLLGPVGGDVSQPVTDEAVQQMMKQPDNFVRQVADEYSRKNAGGPYELPQIPESSLVKQSPIGRVFGLAATDDPVYKATVFDAYAKKYPKLVERSGAQNYDQLMEASYRQLAKETEQQFRALPINMSYHRAGEGNYDNSKELLRDIYGNRHMYVYQGGDPHDFLNAVDPSTGLNTNEMFRAVHDFFGHAIHGNQFGPKGEEIAWAAHSKMFSPLARLAMTSETRGQNSFVNYTPLNAELKARINELNGQAYEARRRGQTAMLEEINKDLAEAWQQFQFAPQKSVILPPEFLDLSYKGGMPSYIQPLIQPEAGTTTAAKLTHFSTKPGLIMTDPRMYGTGIKGEEMARLKDTPGAVMERSYFYAGEPGKITPEPGLGPYRYGAESAGLYDVAADPLNLRKLAVESQRRPYNTNVNPGMVTGSPFTDVERMAKEYGYEGVVNPNLTKPTAIMFKPTPVQPYKKGGKVRFAESPDAMRLELAGGGAIKDKVKEKIRGMASAIGQAAESAGQKAPVVAEKDLTTLQDFHTTLGDRIRQGVIESQKKMDAMTFKYDKGQRVFTEDSAKKNKAPYEIIRRTMVGNQPMRADHPTLGPGMGRVLKDPQTGQTMRTPYEPGYIVRSELGPDEIHEFQIPESAIKGDVEMKRGGAVKKQAGGAIKNLVNKIRNQHGSYEAKRLERAADEVKNLENLYEERALEGLFRGDNAKGIMTMKPEDFEKFSNKLLFEPKAEKQFLFEPSYSKDFPPNMTQEEYIRYLAGVRGFSDVPFLEFSTTPPRKKPAPFVSGHEGRHRSRALVEAGQPTSIVQFLPRAELREFMPRRSREEYLHALNEELERTNRMVRPQKESPDKKTRPLVQLPPVYKNGGKVKFTDNLDAMRLAVQKRK